MNTEYALWPFIRPVLKVWAGCITLMVLLLASSAVAEVGPRARGMAGAVVASASGPSAVENNPAGLARNDMVALQLSGAVYQWSWQRTDDYFNVDLWDEKYSAAESGGTRNSVPAELLFAAPLKVSWLHSAGFAVGVVLPRMDELNLASTLESADGRVNHARWRRVSTQDVRAVAGLGIAPASWVSLGATLEGVYVNDYYLWSTYSQVLDGKLHFEEVWQARNEMNYMGLGLVVGLQLRPVKKLLELGAVIRLPFLRLREHTESWDQRLIVDNLAGELTALPWMEETIVARDTKNYETALSMASGIRSEIPRKCEMELNHVYTRKVGKGTKDTHDFRAGLDLIFLRPVILRLGAKTRLSNVDFARQMEGAMVGGQSADFYGATFGTGYEFNGDGDKKRAISLRSIDFGVEYMVGIGSAVALNVTPWSTTESWSVSEASLAMHSLSFFVGATLDW